MQSAKHVKEITNATNQLLIAFEYDQSLMDGRPFSIGTAEVKRHYRENYRLSLLDSMPVTGGLKGAAPATENIWLLGNN